MGPIFINDDGEFFIHTAVARARRQHRPRMQLIKSMESRIKVDFSSAPTSNISADSRDQLTVRTSLQRPGQLRVRVGVLPQLGLGIKGSLLRVYSLTRTHNLLRETSKLE